MDTNAFTCTICGEASLKICTFCTKDTCSNHLCERCHRCSDCCTCDVPLGETLPSVQATIAGISLAQATGTFELEEDLIEEEPTEEEDVTLVIPSLPTSEPL